MYANNIVAVSSIKRSITFRQIENKEEKLVYLLNLMEDQEYPSSSLAICLLS